jgi:hypothetical protein
VVDEGVRRDRQELGRTHTDTGASARSPSAAGPLQAWDDNPFSPQQPLTTGRGEQDTLLFSDVLLTTTHQVELGDVPGHDPLRACQQEAPLSSDSGGGGLPQRSNSMATLVGRHVLRGLCVHYAAPSLSYFMDERLGTRRVRTCVSREDLGGGVVGRGGGEDHEEHHQEAAQRQRHLHRDLPQQPRHTTSRRQPKRRRR